MVKNGVAQVTLVGAVGSAQQAAELIGRDLLFSTTKDIDVPRVHHALSLIFPGENDGLVGLEPDLIGEHHVLEVLTSDALVDDCLRWAGEDQERRQHILRVLNRATRPEHGEKARRAEAQLARLIETRAALLGGDLIEVAVETPGRLLDLCCALEAQVESLDEPALIAMDAALEMYSRSLMELSVRVAERLVQLARKNVHTIYVDVDASEIPPAADDPVETFGSSRSFSSCVGRLTISPSGSERSATASPPSAGTRRRWRLPRRPSKTIGSSRNASPTPSSTILQGICATSAQTSPPSAGTRRRWR